MRKLTIQVSFRDPKFGARDYSESIDVEDDLNSSGLDYLARHMLRECHVELIYRIHRGKLPRFDGFSEVSDWSPSQDALLDLNRWAAHENTAETWLQIQNVFYETAHLLAQAHAYRDLEINGRDEDEQLLLHVIKMQVFNSAVFTMSKGVGAGFFRRSLAAHKSGREAICTLIAERAGQGGLSVERMCELSGVSRAGFYRHWEASAPRRAETALRDAIQQVIVEKRFYGYRRVQQAIRGQTELTPSLSPINF